MTMPALPQPLIDLALRGDVRMTRTPLPLRETERLAALRDSQILDSPPAIEFDAIALHVRDLLDIPFCFVTLVDQERQWFKAKCGLDVDSIPREIAFCNWTILADDVFVIEDTASDPRFRDNPLVAGPPYVRFYAGAPLLIRPGIAIGSLCVAALEPRRLTANEATALQRLATVVTGLIQGHTLAREAVKLVQSAEGQRQVVQDQARELALRERRFQQTERMASVGGWDFALDTETLGWSDEIYRIHEVPVGTPIDMSFALSFYAPAERVRVQGLLEASLREGTPFDAEFEILTASGARKWVRAIGEVEQRDGAPYRIFGTFQDVSQRHQMEMRLWTAANRDALTGLANRNAFNQAVEAAFASDRSPPGLLMVDADRLKEVNDTLGHDAGDALIRTIAARLEGAVGERGTVARVGGDEFAVLVTGPVDPDVLHTVADQIIAAMRTPFSHAGNALQPQVSVGGAIGGLGAAVKGGPENLRQEADLALYQAKDMRRGGYVAFRADLRSAIMKRIAAVGTVDEAIVRGTLVAWYQPAIELTTGRISAVEAIPRLQRDDVTHPIGEFAEALSDGRTASRVTACLMQRIECDVIAWRAAGVSVPRIALAAGWADFQREDFADSLLGLCARAGFGRGQLAIEVTESVFLSRHAETVARTARRLREQGIIVALDNFGSGYASLAHLGTVPVDVIKIDRSFVDGLVGGEPLSLITPALIDLAHKLGVQVVAEGVETGAQLERLIALGCDKAQGGLISPALPPAAMAAFLAAFRATPRGVPAGGPTPIARLTRLTRRDGALVGQ